MSITLDLLIFQKQSLLHNILQNNQFSLFPDLIRKENNTETFVWLANYSFITWGFHSLWFLKCQKTKDTQTPFL